MNARDVRKEFREQWREAVVRNPRLATDKPAQREAFAVFVDQLHREGRISDKVAQNATLD